MYWLQKNLTVLIPAIMLIYSPFRGKKKKKNPGKEERKKTARTFLVEPWWAEACYFPVYNWEIITFRNNPGEIQVHSGPVKHKPKQIASVNIYVRVDNYFKIKESSSLPS